MTFDARPHRETLEAMLVGLAGRLEEPRSVAVTFDEAGNVELEVIGRTPLLGPAATGAGADLELEAFRHTVHAHALAEATGPAPLVDGYDRLAARIDAAIPERAIAGF